MDASAPADKGTIAASDKADDADTCRICRGEGTPEEPLFFPCKCSGSIKYVHQECLMEWLSHSQKKYCELCKTSFRFTKLYHPGMPTRIPTSIFVRRAAIHVLKLFLTWCRAVLVTSVWLVVLPWCMRVVWRSLFWVGDGGWTRDDTRIPPTSPSAALPADPTFWAIYVERFLLGVHQTPLPSVSIANATSNNATAVDFLGPRSPSLLSDIPFFNWFPSQAANRFLLDVLEGQIITLLVVVAFILIFLIREWVVQQQPVINMVALGDNAAAQRAQEQNAVDDADEEGEEDDGLAWDVRIEDDPLDLPTPPEPAMDMDEVDAGEAAELREVEPRENEADVEEEHPFERARRERARRIDELINGIQPGVEEDDDDDDDDEGEEEQHNEDEPVFTTRTSSLAYRANEEQEDAANSSESSSSSSQRPHMPARDQSSVATEIRRGLEENNTWSFNDIPQLPDHDEHSKSEKAPDSWDDEEARHATVSDNNNHNGGGGGGSSSNPRQTTTAEQYPGSDNSSESWQQIPDILVENTEEPPKDKGKERQDEQQPGSSENVMSTLAGPSHQSEGAPTDASTCGSDSYRDTFVSDTEPDNEEQPADAAREASPERPEEAQVAEQPPIRGIRERVLDWVYRDVGPGAQGPEDAADDELVVQALADFEQFDQIARGNERGPNAPIQDPEVAAAAAQAGIDVNDQDAIDDAEDLEGIMELIGMQGPLTGLFQNAMFSAVLISATLACAVWLPYLWGKVVILFMGSPVALFVKLPLQIIATLADLFVDGALCVFAGGVYWALQAIRVVTNGVTLGLSKGFLERPIVLVTGPAYNIAISAANRLSKLVSESPLLPPPSYFRLSMNSHVALRTIQNTTSHTLNQTSAMVATLCDEFPGESASKFAILVLRRLPASVLLAVGTIYNRSAALLAWLLTTKSYKITFDIDLNRNVNYAYAALEQWTATDRLIAVLAGYGFFAAIGAVYLRRGSPITSSQQGQKVERIIAEILQQAGGVLKVILIISIEMLVFPLYCGLLLDMALLPLFKDASLVTRWQFTRESPWTSGFVHWFIGTCYMFHFALFVSMCRKILRKGVLYFIRDPDDPTFHPVRDVLERSVTTQLRKIAFSGLVYGGLVIVCLGGVVWTLNKATVGVLPIHWVSHAPSLEFPLDLLFYNFLTPVVIKFYKPSDGLHAVSRWWFKLCARGLRMSNFLFGDKIEDEEVRNAHGEKVFDGKYVRAPASDQVRIPKGDPVFIEVDEHNVRKDGIKEGGVHNNDSLVTKVYIPPWFRVRIALFVFTIWIFAAVAGISVTIIPLIFGRYVFSLFLPKDVEMNDIHAFSLGIYTIGSVAYTAYQAFKFLRSLRPIPSPLTTIYNVTATTARISLRVARFAYVWTSLVAIVPLLFAIIIELYLLMPLHAYFGPKEPHVVHIIQDWTLGFLYARLAARMIFSRRTSRPARAFSAVIADGYLNPNAKIATRCFLLPAVTLFLIAMCIPAGLAWTLLRTVLVSTGEATKAMVWRFCYPVLGLAGVAVWAGKEGMGVLGRWRGVVRDEVYLIGERLHNFGERRARAGGAAGVAVAVRRM